MSYQSLKHIEVKSTRKPHYCHGCMIKFPAGSNMMYSAGIFEGQFSDTYWCKCCDAFVENALKEDRYTWEDGIGEGEFRGEPTYKEFKEKFESK